MNSPVKGWTESRYFGYIRSSLRRAFIRFPPKYQTLAASKQGRNQYKCAECGDVFGRKDVAVDHIEPCGSLKSYEDVSGFVERLFCNNDGLQVLCTDCHNRKGYTDRGMTYEDIAVAQFKKLTATGQKLTLQILHIEPESNETKRIEQYRGTL